jgi:GR25 family glycosyltransferase involved in LPS biosynthesis
MPSTLNVFVIHESTLVHRKEGMEQLKQQLEKELEGRFSVNWVYVANYDAQECTKMDLKNVVNFSKIEAEPLADFNKLLKSISIQCVSNNLKHWWVLQYIGQKSSDTDVNLILEDDVFLHGKGEHLLDILRNVAAKTAPTWDMVFLGFPSQPAAAQSQSDLTCRSVKELYRVLPSIDSYLVSKKCANVIAPGYLPLKFVGNVNLSYTIHKHSLEVYMTDRQLFMDGSKYGTDVSSLNPNNFLIYNPVYRELFQLVQKTSDFTAEDKNKLDALWTTVSNKMHPDNLYLKALFLMKTRDFKNAKTMFDTVFDIYNKQKAFINRESLFMNNYIELFKVLQ